MPESSATLGSLLAYYWPVLAISLAVSLAMTPLCRRFALARRIVDKPDDYLKPHGRPIAYLGGVAILLGWAAGLIFAMLWCETDFAGSPNPDTNLMLGVLCAGVGIMLLGLWDDVRHATPLARLAVTVALGGLLVACGLGDDFVPRLVRALGGTFLPQAGWADLLLTVPLTLFVIIGACNATNVLDGLDGLAAGVLGIIHIGFLGLAVYLHLDGVVDAHDAPRVVLALAVIGGALGFLPYNRFRASIFMGDAGSLLLGLNAAILILLLAETASAKFAMAGLVVFALPVADMALAMFRRWRSGKPMMQGDRSHFYDQLVDRGWSVPKVAATAYTLAGGYALLAWIGVMFSTLEAALLYAGVGAATVLAIWMAGMGRSEPGAVPRPNTDEQATAAP